MIKSLVFSFAYLIALQSCAQKDNSINIKLKTMTHPITDSTKTPIAGNTNAVATFGTGCFWCTEAIFQQLEGVDTVTSGYSGGHVVNPTYQEVCSKTTGHAECLQIEYDSTIISFDELLEIFWQVHNPTTLNRQGADTGPQYRSVIFFHDNLQKEKAEKYKEALNQSGAFENPIVTTLEKFTIFYPAENYHQNYYNNNSEEGYCQMVIRPKLEKFEKVFKSKLKKH
ncbi:MAG: peptide-methionine (S)-S-oxide reductase MsrA [Chitinophagaceae bacterium]